MELKELGKTGFKISAIGQGTWGMGGFYTVNRSRDEEAIRALRIGIELGMTFIDTAESYAAGHSEEIVGMAIKDIRDEVFIATKVSPENLSYDAVIRSAEASLRRLGISTIDLYQVHFPNPRIPIRETMRAMEKLVKDGKVRFIGVSNFSTVELKDAMESLAKEEIVSNQVEYNLLERGIEKDLLPFCEKEKVTVIAYSPLARGKLSYPGHDLRAEEREALKKLSEKYEKSFSQIALNWLIEKNIVVAIPKAIKIEHVKENAGSAGWRMMKEDYEILSKAFAKRIS